MGLDEPVVDGRPATKRIWRFADCEFDELRHELRVRGEPACVESKPLDVLLQLLLHAGEVLTKEELLESAWPGLIVVDGSLATAISKLRKALGGEQHPAVVTIPRIGYKLAVPVHCQVVAGPAGSELALKPGEAVPGRDAWRLVRRMEPSGSGEVWLARNPKTGEQRIFKLAADGERLKGLKREITVSRFLRESLGDRPGFVRILEWNLASPPFFLESEYAGPSLAEWAVGQDGLDACPLSVRIDLFVAIAEIVAAAHSVGVLHKDLKPANVLVVPGAGGGRQIRIADFGSASLFDPARLQALGITNLGFTKTVALGSESISGTLMYIAPEVQAGQSPSTGSDVYALGVMLWQFVVGDFRRPLAPGWEAAVEDPLLREDIADAACGDPEKRMASAADLAERLRTLEQRRIRRDELESARSRALVAEKKLAAARTRRPWMWLAGATLALGLVVSLVLYRSAIRGRDTASRETAIAASMNRFLADDLLGRTNPFASGRASESLLDAIKQASPGIDRQFKDAPLVAAHLHQSIARALDNRTDYPDARREYDRAAELFTQAEGNPSPDAIITRLQRATLEARSYEGGTLPLAKSMLRQQETLIARLPSGGRPDIAVWDASARGMIALIGNDAKRAAQDFQEALARADALPLFDESARLAFKQRLAFVYVRIGKGAEAERLFRELAAAYTRLAGPDSANVLRVRLNLAQAYMIQNKYPDAIREANAIYPDFVSRLGADHELILQLLSTRAQSEGALGQWDDSVRDDSSVYQAAVRKHGPYSFYAVATLSDVAMAQCRGGHLAEGQANATKAYDASAKGFGSQAGLTSGTAYTEAECLIDQGKLAQASLLLQRVDVRAVAQLTGDPDFGAEVKLAQAQIAYRQGDSATARKDIAEVAPVFARSSPEPYEQRAFETLKAALERPSSQR